MEALAIEGGHDNNLTDTDIATRYANIIRSENDAFILLMTGGDDAQDRQMAPK